MKKILLGLALILGSITSAEARLNITPYSLQFGSVKVNTTSFEYFWVTNIGMSVVRVWGCNSFGMDFTCNLNCFGVLQPGEMCMGTAQYSPRSEGMDTDNLIIQTNEGSNYLPVYGLGIR